MRDSWWRRLGLALLLVPVGVGEAAAQRARTTWSVPESARAAPEPPGEARAFLYSAVLPGAGQYRLGQKRGIAYAVLEAAGWWWYLDRRAEGRDFEAQYRDLAWTVARQGGAGPRRDGDFEYYEALAKYARSGAYDVDPGRDGVQPETDAGTFNGVVWALAQAIYLPSGAGAVPEDAPEYQLALAYYREHAAGPEFAWSWDGNAAAQQRYRELLATSDDALRSATRALGLILANHIVSAVDAFVTARLRARPGVVPPVNLESALRIRGGGEASWIAAVRIPWPRR
ncbi:MAG TPA: hypothetical protein VF158_09485 [Longimicrobiales bacterium]